MCLSMYGFRTHHQVAGHIRPLINSNRATRRAAEQTNPLGEGESDCEPRIEFLASGCTEVSFHCCIPRVGSFGILPFVGFSRPGLASFASVTSRWAVNMNISRMKANFSGT